MLASPVNQLSDSDKSDIQRQSANLLTLNTSGLAHEPVLLTPGKWTIGSAESNQIILNDERIAACQFLVIVTEHRSIIKDWSGEARWNGNPFESAVLSDGDVIQIADVQLTFQLAESSDLISQLPCVAEPTGSDKAEAIVSDRLNQYVKRESTSSVVDRPVRERESDQAAHQSEASSSVENRLDGLVARIGTGARQDSGRATGSTRADASRTSSGGDRGSELSSIFTEDARRQSVEHEAGEISLSSNQPATPDCTQVDRELQELEELRTAVRLEREQLLAKREVLAQETLNVQKQIDELTQNAQSTCDEPEPSTQEADIQAVVADAPRDEPAEHDEPAEDTTIAASCDHDAEVTNDTSLDHDSSDEEAAVIVEREKLRQYLEEFDSAEDVATEESVEDEEPVAVGAAQLSSENSLTNAMRSRDDAVRQLDDLVLAATQSAGSESVPTSDSTTSGFGGGRSLPGRENLLASESQTASLPSDSDESESALENTDLEESVDALGNLVNEAVSPDLPLDIDDADETVDDFASRETVHEYTHDSSTDTAVSGGPQVSELSFVEYETDEAPSETSDKVDDDCVDGTAGSDTADGCGVIHGVETAGETESTDFPTRQRDDIDEPVEEAASDESFGSIFGSRDIGEDGPSFESELDESPLNSLIEPDQTEAETPTEGAPSWFDSTLMSDSEVVEGDKDAGAVSPDAASSDDTGLLDSIKSGSNSEPESETTGDLRKKLAEMFDLPALSENQEPAAPDMAVEEQIRHLRGDGRSEETPANNSEPVSPWSDSDSLDSIDESSADTHLEFTTDSDVSPDADYESETLDQFPASESEEELIEEPQVVGSSSLDSVPGQDEAGEEDSISAYMERLLARNRKTTGASAPVQNAAVASSDSSPSVRNNSEANSSASGTEESDDPSNSPAKPETWLEDTPRHRQNRDQVRAEVDVLRQIANQSARSAVATASRRNVRNQVLVKTIASVLALGSGVAALILEISFVFGLIVLAIGMVFSVDLTLTIFRNWKQMRQIRKAATAISRETGTGNSSDSKTAAKPA